MKKNLIEGLGTLFLVFSIFSVIAEPSLGNFGAVAIGMTLMIAVYFGGHISGAHYNPAVSTALLTSGNFSPEKYPAYVLFQVAGAVGGMLIALLIKFDAVISPASIFLDSALLAEFVWTFLLSFVVLNVAVSEGTKGNSFYGFAIGGTVLVGALILGPVSGGAFNPAVTVALGVAGILDWADVVMYVTVQLLAGAIAGLSYKALVQK